MPETSEDPIQLLFEQLRSDGRLVDPDLPLDVRVLFALEIADTIGGVSVSNKVLAHIMGVTRNDIKQVRQALVDQGYIKRGE